MKSFRVIYDTRLEHRISILGLPATLPVSAMEIGRAARCEDRELYAFVR